MADDETQNPVDDPAASTTDAAGPPPEQPPTVGETVPETPAPPAASASKAKWVEYATTQAAEDKRLTPAEASAHTRDQLAAMFAPAKPPPPEPGFGWFQTEGGSIVKMDFPLDKAIAERVVKRAIIQVTEDGTPLEDPAPLDLNSVDYVATFAPPPKTASRAVWIGHAVRHGRFTVEGAEAMTTQDLIDYFYK